ncbi:MAG: hypothetical protein GX096_06685 [Clostridiales bacterium]|nr:hypothetical protein [Clostridiales bacterium]
MFHAFLQDHDLGVLLLPREARHPFPKREDRKDWDALCLQSKAEIIKWGNEALEGYPLLTATQFLAFVRTGDRQAYEVPYFQRRKKLIGAVLAECIVNDGSYLDAVIDGLWLICEETSWVISAHNGSSHRGMPPAKERPLPDVQNPYIDLFAAQTSATLSYALYFLEDRLDAVSPLIARRVRQEIEHRIIRPFMSRDDFWWMGMIRKDMNNWTPWILSNIIDTLLLVENDDIRLAQGLKRALLMLDSYLDIMPADGGCDEGCGYWNMAGGSLLDCLESLYLATGGQVNFYDNPHIRAIGAFPMHAHIEGEYYLNFADCDAKPMLDAERLYRYGMRTDNAVLCNLGASIVHAAPVKSADTPQMNRVLFSLFHHVEEVNTEVQSPMAHVILPDLQIYTWRKNGFYAAIKGGHNAEGHNHNDCGQFVIYVDGQPKVIDAGNMLYTAKTFSEERYTLWNTRSMYHNVPIIGGFEQHEGREFAAKVAHADDTSVTFELAKAYPMEADAVSFERTLEMMDAGARIRDHITLAREAEISWVLMLRDKPKCTDDVLIMEGLTIRYCKSLTVSIEEIPVADERMRKNFEGSLWRAVCTACPSMSFDITFEFVRS